MITLTNLAIQFGKRVLFDEVNIKFTKGNCYGIIGANGAGKSTFLKILSGKQEPTTGSVSLESGKRMSVLEQDHFAYDQFTVLETVLRGNKRMFEIKEEMDALYAKPDFSDEDGIKAGELGVIYDEMGGWNAETDAQTMLSNVGIKEDMHWQMMSELENKDQVAHAVGVGAIKFYDLKTDRTNGYDFDLEAMVSFEGETGPYVQYAYARIQSILRKADFKPDTVGNYSLNDAESWEIIKLLQDFPRIINRAADNFEPSIIAKFAISLAQAFNKYYAHTRILDESPERDSRLALSYATAVVLKEALRLLGVEAPEKM